MDFNAIQVEKAGVKGIIYLNQPETRNALSKEIVEELTVALEGWASEDEVRVIIITGRGPTFCSGGDLRRFSGIKPFQGRKQLKITHPMIRALRDIEKPTIAAINGAAIGAGWSLALLCDLVVASEKASFSMAFAKIGVVPDCGSMHFLPRAIGLLKAKELMMTGRTIDVQEACDLGLVNRVVPPDQLITSALELADVIAQNPPLSLGLLKNGVNRAIDIDYITLLEEEAMAQDICMQTEDHKEAVRAFFEKRKPQFIGR